MRYLPLARNPILPRRVQTVLFIVSSGLMAGFGIFDRLATLSSVTRLTGQLTKALALNLMQCVSLLHLRVTSSRTTNLVAWLFHPWRYLINVYARFVAYQRTQRIEYLKHNFVNFV
jgi:UDP-N-acetylmuramyl pentapeptide phosphotransferase/UDP-N-acetylglucosamine-1-phosphate transferase